MPIVEAEFIDLTRNLDLDAFWQENDLCHGFTTDKPRCALAFSPDDHWIFEFMGVPSTLRYYHDTPYRNDLHRQVNAITRQYVGRAFFDEDTWNHQPRRIENLFGSEFTYLEGGTPWLTPVTNGFDDQAADDFARILDQAESIEVRQWALPEPYLREWETRKATGKSLPTLGGGSRGPATIMTSVLPPETVFYWCLDRPRLMTRFRDLLADRMVALNTILRDFSDNNQPGWWITDDNCALFNADLYREFCYPVLQRVLDALAPAPAMRHQHSDSAMAHLLDMQYELGIRSVNYGPTVDAGLIRQKMPDAYIRGQLPPMMLRNDPPQAIEQRVIADFHDAGQSGGLEITTAGSLAAGTGVGRMRWLMAVVQTHCRYHSA